MLADLDLLLISPSARFDQGAPWNYSSRTKGISYAPDWRADWRTGRGGGGALIDL